MSKEKRIKLRQGCRKLLAEEFGVSGVTVWRALNYVCDTELQERIRERARERGYVRKF